MINIFFSSQKQFSIYLTLDQYMKPDVRRNTLVTFMKEFFKKVRHIPVTILVMNKLYMHLNIMYNFV